MARYYRALISMPVSAENDNDALTQAYAHARSLLRPESTAIGGHLELLTEVHDGAALAAKRIVMEDETFRIQLP